MAEDKMSDSSDECQLQTFDAGLDALYSANYIHTVASIGIKAMGHHSYFHAVRLLPPHSFLSFWNFSITPTKATHRSRYRDMWERSKRSMIFDD